MTQQQSIMLNCFIEDERLRGKRESYLKGLKNRVPKLFEYLNDNDINLNAVKITDALSFQKHLIENRSKSGARLKNISINCIVNAAVTFYNYLKREGIISVNPFKEIRRMRENRRLPRNVLKEKDMSRFLTVLSEFEKEKGLKKQIRRYRVSVIAELMYSTGLRISEVTKLKPTDIDFDRGVVNVVDGKGGKSRIAFLNDYAKEVLKIYISDLRDVISNEWNSRNDALLFGIKSGWLEKTVNLVLKEVLNSLNLPVITSHAFRHAVGFHLLRAGSDIRYIQALLGHSRLKTTEVYTKVEKEDLKRIIDKFHPRKLARIYDEALNG